MPDFHEIGMNMGQNEHRRRKISRFFCDDVLLKALER
jgi:hypothetical protein